VGKRTIQSKRLTEKPRGVQITGKRETKRRETEWKWKRRQIPFARSLSVSRKSNGDAQQEKTKQWLPKAA